MEAAEVLHDLRAGTEPEVVGVAEDDLGAEKIELVGTAGVTAAGLAVLRRLPHLLELSVSEVPGVTEQATAGFRPEVVVDVRA